jgi:hypothetical protein
MNLKLLELHREQLRLAFYRISTIHLSDSRLADVRNAIGVFINELQKVDFEIEKKNDLYYYRDSITLLQEWTGWIANQQRGTKPHAVIRCLDIAASEWLDTSTEYIFVATDGDFCIFSDDPSVDLLLDWIYQQFKIFFAYRLVHIQIPFHLDDDYLFNVCLYHELGHFIDSQLKVTDNMAITLSEEWNKNNPNSGTTGRNCWEDNIIVFQRHMKEVFADVFAAQYVGKKIIEYILFRWEDVMNRATPFHPAPSFRIAMIEELLHDYKNNNIFDYMNDAITTISGNSLSKRDQIDGIILTANNITYLPTNIYQVFTASWDTYLHHVETVGNNVADSYKLTCRSAEQTINRSLV